MDEPRDGERGRPGLRLDLALAVRIGLAGRRFPGIAASRTWYLLNMAALMTSNRHACDRSRFAANRMAVPALIIFDAVFSALLGAGH